MQVLRLAEIDWLDIALLSISFACAYLSSWDVVLVGGLCCGVGILWGRGRSAYLRNVQALEEEQH